MIGTARFKPKRKLMNEDFMDEPDKIGLEFMDVGEYLFADVWYF
jgi:hypothetical protein